MATTNFTFTSEDGEVTKALERMARMMQALRDENKKLKEESKESSSAAAEGAEDAATSMESAASSAADYFKEMMNVGKAVEFVVNELKSLHAVQDRAAESARNVADAQRSFLRNLGNVPEAERSAAIASVKRISAQTGVDEATMYTAASTAESARGGASRTAWEGALRQAALVAPDSPQEMDATAGGLLDLVSLTKTENAKANTGFMAAMGAQTRIKNLEFINKNLVPAAIGVGQYGGSAPESAAIVDTLTQLSKDPTGATSGTAALAMAQQLAEALPEKDRYEYDSKGRRKLAAKGTGLTSTLDRIKHLQQNEREREQFMATASFEKTQRPFVASLLSDNESLGLLQSNIGSFPTSEGALEGMAGEYVKGLNATPIQQQANTERKLKQTKDALRLANLKQGDRSIIAQEVQGILQETQQGTIHNTLVGWDIRDESQGATAYEKGIEALQHRVDEFTGKSANVSGPMMGFMKETINKEEQVAYLKEMIAYLKSINEEQKKGKAKNIDRNVE